ncbi:MAG: hypothetical protein ACI9OJ_001290 [Myxococcota bacterium]|jgi:hypothetical protein
MRMIDGDFWTHCPGQKLCKATAKEVAKSEGYLIRSFRELVEHVAELGYLHRWRNLLYRGQRNDRLDRTGGTALHPSIYRPPRGKKTLSASELKSRFELLDLFTDKLRERHYDLTALPGLARFSEYQLALLQHYDLCPTPLMDLTHSLRVAATFALLDYDMAGSSREKGWVYVFGMPHPHGSLSYFMDERIVLLKLQSFCPPQALRPHFQEGYLTGALPYVPKRQADQSLARRLVGKYQIINENNEFWGNGFDPIPPQALLPTDDPFIDELKSLLV